MDRETAEEERRRVELGRAIAREVAARLARQLGGTVHRSDLESIGHEALVTLLRGHDPSASPLEPYLRRFLRWAMLDALRSAGREGVLAWRVRGLAACQWLSAASDDPDHVPEDADPLGAFRDALSMRATALLLAGLGGAGVAELAADSTHFPERVAIREREREQVRTAIASLAEPMLRDVLVRHYFGDEPFDRMAFELGMSATQICRLHRRALAALDKALRSRGLARGAE
jgi:RNA polymerase sigma factor (sigma-70 family)